ncbi:type IV secretion system DNA-binding domain-containing protein [Candidatus Pacearchaeota archaeon]|nr:type IV secretion system DNA-binding domain-containing protein [Candidatus Pacearchaeota archaeon]
MNFLTAVLAISFLYLIFHFFRALQLSSNNRKIESVVLRVAVSKINERGPIVAEQIYSALHGLEKNYGFVDYLFGRPKPRISLEIASVNNLIQFFVWAPRKYKNVIESQIYAQYPDVEISEVDDYSKEAFNLFEVVHPTASTVSDSSELVEYEPQKASLNARASSSAMDSAITAELRLTDPYIYPLKRYSQFEDKMTRLATEPLAGITATLSKLNATDEQAWIQITMEPTGDWWRKRGLKCLKIVSGGLFSNSFWLNKMATKIYLARGFWKRFYYSPLYLLFWMLRGFKTGELSLGGSKGGDDDLDEQVSRTHDREDPISAGVDKVTRLSFDTNIRIVYIPRPENRDLADIKLNEIASSFSQFNMPNMNSFDISKITQGNRQMIRRYQQRQVVNPMILNVEEIATIYHMPSKDVGTPNVFWVNSRRLEPPHDLPLVGIVPDEELTIIGKTNFRGAQQGFGIKTVDRRRHIYIIGKTGMGKSVLLENMIKSDVDQKKGLAVIDPHGDLAESVIDFVPSHRINDVVILDPSDISHPFAFNMLESGGDPHRQNLIASGLLGVFKKMYADSWGPRLEHILRNCLLALAETPNSSMLGIMRILVDAEYRRKVVNGVSNPMVKSFWVDEFGKFNDKMRTEAISPIQNKVGQFLSSPMIRNILGQVKSTVNIRFMMDTGKILIINLSKGKIGEDNSSLLGSMLITKFQLDAMSRADIDEKDRKDFYLYVDEFQNFATDSFATILSEARKYKLNLTMANQYIAQMPDEVRDAVFGNVGTLLNFQVGFDDAEYFSGQFSEEVLPNDIISLPKYNCYTKLMIDGMPSKTFSLSTFPPPVLDPEENRREKIVRLSRERYCTTREIVEDKINRWMAESADDKKKFDKGEDKKKFDKPKSEKPKVESSKSEKPKLEEKKSDKPKKSSK